MATEGIAPARVRISGGRGSAIERALFPTPYAAELIAEDVAHAGRDARVEIDAVGLGPAAIATLEAGMSHFAGRGVQITWHGRNDEERAL